MPEFILNGKDASFNRLDAFTQGFIEALFFTEEERLCEESEGERETAHVVIDMATMELSFRGGNSFGFSDLSQTALATIAAECAVFQERHAITLDYAYTHATGNGYDAAQAGRDFWFTRNGHGVGFWDRDQLDDVTQKQLTAACGWRTKFQEMTVYVGDDGTVHVN